MQKEFWQDKWQHQQIGFHLENAHPLLQKFHRHVFAGCETVFVPLCGKSKDLVFLAEQNYEVIGNELSDKAVRAFYWENYLLDELKKPPESQQYINIDDKASVLEEYSFEDVSIFQGDFFQLRPEQLKNSNAIYDRAALIALPEAMREGYVSHYKRLFRTASLLLITLEYDQSKMSGPPFSVTQNEVESLFEHAQVEILYRKDIIEKEPRFRSKGLDSFIETAYKIVW